MPNQQPDYQLFESVFKHATMGILVTDAQGLILLANKFSRQEFGYTREELIGKRVETLIPARFHDQHTKERYVYQQEPETRAMGAGRDLFGLRKDGSEFPVEVSLSPFRSDNDAYVIAFIIDITARKEKEANEIEYRKKIAGILASLRKEKELNDMKSKFVSLASHEFKTPLSTILTSASLLSKYTTTEDQPRRDKHIERIKSAVGNLNGILNEFLSISRIENGKIGVRFTAFDIDEFLKGICTEIEDLKVPGQQISCSCSGSKTVSLDRELLHNVMVNLLTNAIKFSGKNDRITITSQSSGDVLSISVRDNGLGISEEDQRHLFERFYRGGNALTIPGTGLGLHIVRKYVELMRGTIDIKSELNKGTEILLNFKQ